MNTAFDKVKKNFGFGCMRFPMNGDEVNHEEVCRMVDAFLEAGFNYFDTAHGYLGGKSETALRECLTSRYPREAFVLTNKLSTNYFKKNEDIRPFFEEQLKICGVDYFDFYLMHAQNRSLFAKYKAHGAYETCLELKKEGKIRHFGISFHDTADVLDQILTEYPQIEVVQIQFNYLDYEDASVQSRLCLECCRKHGKPVIVMEPVKGGSLVNLPDEAKAILDELQGGSYASYAIRYAAGFDGIFMVLSGMGSMDMMHDNLSYMTDFKPLDAREAEAVEKVCDVFRSKDIIPCTKCGYCLEGCPKKIAIPNLFACMNEKTLWNNWNAGYYYSIHTKNAGKASECIGCGACERICPQKLSIRELLKQVAETFEKE
ncbi:MAG: aldo/keto reductase [Clostridia bacterium]|nr:aldo/keto reductase [Clostridia bacterium]